MSKSIKVLRDQKEEYTEHLFELLNQPLIKVFRKIYDDVMKSKDYAKKNVLKLFQKQENRSAIVCKINFLIKISLRKNQVNFLRKF